MKRTTPDTMQAAVIEQFGGVDEIKIQSIPVPELGPEEVLIRIDTAGVAPWDIYEREGGFAEMREGESRFPYVLGSEGSGTIVAVGDQVSRFQQGDLVFAAGFLNPKGGFYAEYAAVKEDLVAKVPDQLTTEQAGVMSADAVTALRGLADTLHLQSGESLLLFGASGGIGHMALQLAKRMEARVLAVASGVDGVALAKRLGAETVVDGRKEDVAATAREFAAEGLDTALLTAGGEVANKALSHMRNGGRVAYPTGVEPVPRVDSNVQLTRFDGDADAEIIARLVRLIDSGPFEVHVARTFPLKLAAEAHKALGEHYLGKMALKP